MLGGDKIFGEELSGKKNMKQVGVCRIGREAPWTFGRRGFQEEGTANAKALGQDFAPYSPK